LLVGRSFVGARRSGCAVSATLAMSSRGRRGTARWTRTRSAALTCVRWRGVGIWGAPTHARRWRRARELMAHRLYLHIHQPTLGDPLCRGHASVWCGAACGFGNAMQVQESSL